MWNAWVAGAGGPVRAGSLAPLPRAAEMVWVLGTQEATARPCSGRGSLSPFRPQQPPSSYPPPSHAGPCAQALPTISMAEAFQCPVPSTATSPSQLLQDTSRD